MSTSVIHPGTTRSAGPSGRFVGLAAAALAAVIALGFVFSANQGNEATESVTESRVSQAEKAAWNSRVDFLTQQYHMRQASQPTVNIERYRLEKAGLIGAITPSTSPEAYKVLQQQAGVAQVNPNILVTSPELARLQAANTTSLQAMWSQRYQDLIDRFENQMVPSGHAVFSPEAARLSVPAQSLESRFDIMNQVGVRLSPQASSWTKQFEDLMDGYAALNAGPTLSPQASTWTQQFEDLMDSYDARIAAAKVADEAPRAPRDKRS
jgi:hypothetical protein